MKVIGINGSAENDGNTTILINKVFEELHKSGIETELIQLAGQTIEPCKACWACGGKMNCVHKKDQFREIFNKMKEADGILLGSPVYSANISSNMQAVDAMNHFFLNHEMFVSGSTYWNMAYGRLPGEVEQDQEGMANMENLGRNMAYLLSALKNRGKNL